MLWLVIVLAAMLLAIAGYFGHKYWVLYQQDKKYISAGINTANLIHDAQTEVGMVGGLLNSMGIHV
jgi:predicted negative regulator of RcsB-dependent stress response